MLTVIVFFGVIKLRKIFPHIFLPCLICSGCIRNWKPENLWYITFPWVTEQQCHYFGGVSSEKTVLSTKLTVRAPLGPRTEPGGAWRSQLPLPQAIIWTSTICQLLKSCGTSKTVTYPGNSGVTNLSVMARGVVESPREDQLGWGPAGLRTSLPMEGTEWDWGDNHCSMSCGFPCLFEQPGAGRVGGWAGRAGSCVPQCLPPQLSNRGEGGVWIGSRDKEHAAADGRSK
jgi:hypothetical protein